MEKDLKKHSSQFWWYDDLIVLGTPLKTNMTLETPIFNRTYIFIHGGFSIVLFVFGGVNQFLKVFQRSLFQQVPTEKSEVS